MNRFLPSLSPQMRRLLGSAIILLFIALALPPALYAAPAAKAAPAFDAAPGNSATQGAEAAPITDLFALGLSKKPGESAEEILLRAHAGDTTAMALAAVGYDLGINGFPRGKMLALMWIWEPSDWGAWSYGISFGLIGSAIGLLSKIPEQPCFAIVCQVGTALWRPFLKRPDSLTWKKD